MSWTKKYEGTQEEKDKETINDIRFYLGDQFERIEKLIMSHEPPPTMKDFVFSLSFLGIQGYPVEAWARKLGITVTK